MLIRFLSTKRVSGATVSIEDASAVTVQALKEILVREHADFVSPCTTCEEIRFVYAGAFLQDDAAVSTLRRTGQELAIHVVLRPQAPPPQPQEPEVSTAASEPASEGSPYLRERADGSGVELDERAYFHFHGCTVSEEEVVQMRQVFDKYAGEATADEPGTRRISFSAVHSFLRTYWRFVKSRQIIDSDRAFPTRRLFAIKRRIAGGPVAADADEAVRQLREVSFTHEEFLMIYFLFDNDTEDEPCPHGARARVRQATEQMHNQIQPGTPFEDDLFEETMRLVAPEPTSEPAAANADDAEQPLSCRDIDLLYYMYAAKLFERHPAQEEDGEGGGDDDEHGRRPVDPVK